VTGVAANLAAVRGRIAAAAARAGRDPAGVTLVAVAKTHPAAAVAAAAAAGVTDVGENYAQELVAKHAALGDAVRWHFIGRLQRNKVKQVVGRAALIHAVDSTALLQAIATRAAEAGIVQPILLAVSAAGEAQKTGAPAEAIEALAAAARGWPSLRLDGLMTMPPESDDPEAARPYFGALRQLRDRLVPGGALSMGMSADLEVAVEEGATLVRVGTAIFGARPARAG
jgi:PLP dependent protein